VLLAVERDKQAEAVEKSQSLANAKSASKTFPSLMALRKLIASHLVNPAQSDPNSQKAAGVHVIFAMIRDRFTAEDR